MPFLGASDLEFIDVIGFRSISLPKGNYQSIFMNGFKAKEDYASMYYKSYLDLPIPPNAGPLGHARAGDMGSETANCVSTKLSAAALFPNDTKTQDTWIFAVYVGMGFNTYEKQQMDCWEIIEKNPAIHGSHLLSMITWPLAAEEFATQIIPARYVLGAIKCSRNWASDDWHWGGTYTLFEPLYWNAAMIDPNLDKTRVEKTHKFMLKQLAFHASGELPLTPA